MRRRDALPTRDFRPLHPSDFSFHGFGDATSGIERKIGLLGIRTGEPRIAVVEDAVFVPTPDRRTEGPAKSYGGIFTADGQPVELSRLSRRGRAPAGDLGAPGAVAPAGAVDVEVVYLGPLFNHFGRLLLESLARVWALAEVDPSLKVVFDYPTSVTGSCEAWVLRILDAFIPPGRLLVLEEPTRLRRTIVPEPLFEQHLAAHERMIRPFREVAARIAGDVAPSTQPVYLSRRLLSSRQRPIVGEADLEELLRANGFLIAHPQTMPFEDQVRLVNRHADFFSAVGSAAHNVLFALGRSALHLLASGDDIPLNFFLCSALAEAPTTFVDCLGAGGRPSFDEERQVGRERRRQGHEGAPDLGSGAQATPQLAEVAKLVDYLAERGFLRTRPTVGGWNPDPALRDRYDEAWLYARVRAAARRGRTLPPEIEAEARRVAARSWPVSWMLARYYAMYKRSPPEAEAMAEQFAELAAAESDPDRLAYYRAEIERSAARVRWACGDPTAQRLNAVLADRFRPQPEDGVAAPPE